MFLFLSTFTNLKISKELVDLVNWHPLYRYEKLLVNIWAVEFLLSGPYESQTVLNLLVIPFSISLKNVANETNNYENYFPVQIYNIHIISKVIEIM